MATVQEADRGALRLRETWAGWPALHRRVMLATLALVAFLSLGVVWTQVTFPLPGREGGDFATLYAGSRAFRLGGDFYSLADREAAVRDADIGDALNPANYSYPPFFALMILPLSFPLYPAAKLIWLAISTAALATAVVLLPSALGLAWSWRARLLAFALVFLFFPPAYTTLNLGQSNNLLLLLLVLCFLFYRRRIDWAAGICLALATFKVFPAFIALYFLVRKRWTLLAAYVASLGVLAAVGIAFIGLPTHIYYLSHMIPSLSTPSVAPISTMFMSFGNQSIFSQVLHWLVWGGLAETDAMRNIGLGLTLLITSAFIAMTLARAPSADERLAFGAMIPAAMLASGVLEQHHLILLLITYAALWSHIKRFSTLRLLETHLLLLSLILIVLDFYWLGIPHPLWLSWLSLYAVGITLAICLSQLWRAPKAIPSPALTADR